MIEPLDLTEANWREAATEAAAAWLETRLERDEARQFAQDCYALLCRVVRDDNTGLIHISYLDELESLLDRSLDFQWVPWGCG